MFTSINVLLCQCLTLTWAPESSVFVRKIKTKWTVLEQHESGAHRPLSQRKIPARQATGKQDKWQALKQSKRLVNGYHCTLDSSSSTCKYVGRLKSAMVLWNWFFVTLIICLLLFEIVRWWMAQGLMRACWFAYPKVFSDLVVVHGHLMESDCNCSNSKPFLFILCHTVKCAASNNSAFQLGPEATEDKSKKVR